MKYLSILFLLALVSCGGGGGSAPVSVGGNNTGHGCTIEEVAGLGANITCDGVTVFVPNGEKGEKGDTGDTGQNGQDGYNVFAEALSIHTSKRKSVFRLGVYCEYDTDADNIFGDNINTATDPQYYRGSHSGTGFLISGDKIATNNHVAGDDSCDYVPGWKGRVFAITAEAVNNSTDSVSSTDKIVIYRSDMNKTEHSTYDLAKLSVPSSFSVGKIPFEIDSTNDESILTPTLSMSFPLGISDMITNIGEIVTDDVATFTGYDFMTSNDTDGGSSGSPIINIITGKVIGLVTAGFTGVSMNPSIAIHASRLNEF